jgi:hypothetical protein
MKRLLNEKIGKAPFRYYCERVLTIYYFPEAGDKNKIRLFLFFIEFYDYLPDFPQMSFQFSQFFLLSFFLKNIEITQTFIFEIFQNFRPFAFIENLQQPFP